MVSTVRALTAAASLIVLVPVAAVPAQDLGRTPASPAVPERPARHSASVPDVLDVSTDNALSPDFVRTVARIGRPVDIVLTATQTIRQVIEGRCGVVTPSYVAEFVDANVRDGTRLSAVQLETPGVGRTYTFPFCVRPATVQARMRGTIGGLFGSMNLVLDTRALDEARGAKSISGRPLGTLKLFGSGREVGSDGGFVSTELSRKFERDNPDVDPVSTRPGRLLLVTRPETTATVPLRAGATIADARAAFATNRAPPRIDQARLAQLIGDEELLPGECGGVVAGGWPFPPTLGQALRDVVTLRPPSGVRPADVKVMTVDTGYDPALGKPAIDDGSFGYLMGPGTNGVMDRVGLNANDQEQPDAIPPDDLAQRQHGGEVAATLLGGAYLQRVPPLINSPRIAFVSIAAVNSSGAPYLDIGGIGEAMLIARRSGVRIVNASVSALARRDSFLSIVANDQERLIVAAAGNSRAHPAFAAGDLPWPGSMGGDRSNASNAVIVSVGAHDPSGRLLAFSRYGPQVDILAPGCRIPTYTFKDGQVSEVERSGTSFAAPLVSLIASQLALEGLTPSQIKERLIVSADVDEGVVRKSYSGGRLDAVRALSLWRDYVVFDALNADGTVATTTVTGTLESRFATISVCGQEVEQQALRMLALSRLPGPTAVPGTWRGWAEVQGMFQRLDPCAATAGAVSGPTMDIRRDDGGLERVEVASIRSFTARFR